MIRQVADHLAEIFFERKWVDEELRDWCVYTLEKWLGVLLFFLSVTLWMLVSGRCLETLSFLVPFYLLRRRIGGYHTKKPSTCFFASIGLVVLVSTFLGTWLAALPERVLFSMDALVILLVLILEPAYPPQLNFNEEDKRANLMRKNILTVCILMFQIFTILFLDIRYISYSFCGISFVLITVVIQKNIIKGESSNEKN